MRVEVLIPPGLSQQAEPVLFAVASAAAREGDNVRRTMSYEGLHEWLVLYGVGAPSQSRARAEHLRCGGGRHVLIFDIGYFGQGGERHGWYRCSVDHEHPQRWLDATPPEPKRWARLGIELREDFNENGPLLLIGLGRKSRAYLREEDWEVRQYQRIRAEHGANRRVIYRPKPGNHPVPPIPGVEIDSRTPIATLLRGCAGVYCRHSNVAVDAIVAGVPFHAEDGAAMWLTGKAYTRENRLDFLRRLAWWNWRPEEGAQCWSFVTRTVEAAKAGARYEVTA